LLLRRKSNLCLLMREERERGYKMIRIHPSAVVHKDAQLAEDVTIGPNCVIESGVSIGVGTVLDANVVIKIESPG
jgi:acyl-[acyl carrier protein]--UDP-N-acetylglucosamine O-acyltransferase